MVPGMRWRRTNPLGVDECVLRKIASGWELRGKAGFVHGVSVARLRYRVRCDPAFRTRHATVDGSIGSRPVSWRITVSRGRWRLNGRPRPRVDGCDDIDLAFTPATNLLPIRRLRLKVGESAPARAALLSFPRVDLRPLDQAYHRVDRAQYEYRSGRFSAMLTVNNRGFVREYGDLWRADTGRVHDVRTAGGRQAFGQFVRSRTSRSSAAISGVSATGSTRWDPAAVSREDTCAPPLARDACATVGARPQAPKARTRRSLVRNQSSSPAKGP
jgi:hypothetical protein